MLQRLRLPFGLALTATAGALLVVACSSSTNNTGVGADAGPGVTPPAADAEPGDTSTPAVDLLPGCTKDPGGTAPTFDPSSADDPTGGAEKFTLAMALAGFPAGTGKLTAAIDTEKSVIRCELAETAAPISVANFVGLARGTRPYKVKNKWQVGRFYDGLLWHRVIPNFVVQGGDPDGVGTGGPGYDLVNENHVDEPLGTLAMAASKTPSGSQFYVVIGTGPAADYNVFGTCTTEAAIALATVPHDKDGYPDTEIHMLKIQIGRCP
jgi:peptidyl-prolyl cis-trans isomerase A (cyclophilin A)